MLDELKEFENSRPEIVFHWRDTDTEAEGWAVINSLRGGSAGGGTRMRKGLNKDEVLSLAKTMEIKFTISGPPIGGAKSGINFDPDDPRKEGVLRRWFTAVYPLLKTYYGTGGDLNVDEIREVLPITSGLGLLHCQEGTVNGYYKGDEASRKARIKRLQEGVSKPVTDPVYTPDPKGSLTLADLITGWGVAEAVIRFYELKGIAFKNKTAAVQGFGNVGGAAAWYLARAGFKVVAITDAGGGIFSNGGFSDDQIRQLVMTRKSNELIFPDKIPFDEANERIWDCGAQVFLPCARSRSISGNHIERLLAGGLELLSPGANVPFDDNEIFLGPTGMYADNKVTVIPDFVANCGMARAFAYFAGTQSPMTDEAIFSDTTQTIIKALKEILAVNPGMTGLWQTGLKIALEKLKVRKIEKV